MSPRGPLGSGRRLFDRGEWGPETLGHSFVSKPTAIDIRAIT